MLARITSDCVCFRMQAKHPFERLGMRMIKHHQGSQPSDPAVLRR